MPKDEQTKMFENGMIKQFKIDFRDFYPGLKEEMEAFEKLIKTPSTGKKTADKVIKLFKSRYCHICFFGKVMGEIRGEPICSYCAKELYGFDENEAKDGDLLSHIKMPEPKFEIWYRKRMALPVFEAYLNAELELCKLEQKLEEKEQGNADR
jgi:hypothetical protein